MFASIFQVRGGVVFLRLSAHDRTATGSLCTHPVTAAEGRMRLLCANWGSSKSCLLPSSPAVLFLSLPTRLRLCRSGTRDVVALMLLFMFNLVCVRCNTRHPRSETAASKTPHAFFQDPHIPDRSESGRWRPAR